MSNKPAGPPLATPSVAFNPEDLNESGLLNDVIQHLFDNPQTIFAFLRRFWPVLKLPNLTIITRYDDVREALERQDIFEVPFGPTMEELNGGPNFVLGLQDGDAYGRQRRFIMRVFDLTDIENIIVPKTKEISQSIIGKSEGNLDAIADLVTYVPTELCECYFGLQIPKKEEFAMWLIAMSTYTFDGTGGPPGYRRAALAAGELTRALVDQEIRKEKTKHPQSNTVLGRLVDLQKGAGDGPTDLEIRAIVMGLMTGFVPTNTMAGGNMLEMLLTRPDFMFQTRAAAVADDDQLLSRCLFEAMRFKPLNPGPFRRCAHDYRIGGTKVSRGATVLVGTQSAMFDPRRIHRPEAFNPLRPKSDYMLFGSGLHWCVGAFIADAQITQMFKPLLKRPRLRRAPGTPGYLKKIGPFPAHLTVEFDR